MRRETVSFNSSLVCLVLLTPVQAKLKLFCVSKVGLARYLQKSNAPAVETELPGNMRPTPSLSQSVKEAKEQLKTTVQRKCGTTSVVLFSGVLLLFLTGLLLTENHFSSVLVTKTDLSLQTSVFVFSRDLTNPALSGHNFS